MTTEFAICTKCSSEFMVEENSPSTLRCPSCLAWEDEVIDTARGYAKTYYGYSEDSRYVDYDSDNYGFSDSY
jgi:hypothetical protein